MKRLLVALVAAVAVSTVFARITDTQLFEESFADFKADVQDQDSSELAEYVDTPSVGVPYPCASFGSKYLSLDTGDATLWRTNTVDGDVYFDMVVQFNPCTEAPEVDADTKLAVYLDAASNLVVSAGLYSGATKTNLVTNTQIEPGSWHRLSVSSIKEDYESPTTGYKRLFKIYVDGNAVSADVDLVSVGPKTITEFESRVGGLDEKPVSSVGFKGSGALDNFVARTTDPFGTAATIGGETYASLEQALSEAEEGDTVTLGADVTVDANTISTKAATIDLGGKTLTLPQNSSKVASLTFTGAGAKTLKGGDLTGVYHELTIKVPDAEDLTFDGMTFHASVKPEGLTNSLGQAGILLVTNCQFLCDFDKTGTAFTDGSSADVHSYGLLFQNGTTQFRQADVVNNYFDQGRRAAVQACISGDLYFYGNTVVADKLTSRVDGATTRYPALQTMTHGRVFIENNTFSGQYLGEAFCLYNKDGYRSTDAAVVFNGNVVSNGVNHLWGILDSIATGSAPLVNPNLYFGANTVGDQVDTTGCIYKTTVDGVDMNGVTYSHTPATLALPAGVDSVYAWTHAAGAKDLYVDGTPADAVAAGTIIAVPGVEVAAARPLVLTADTTLKNQWTADVGTTWDAYLGAAVDGAYTIDNLSELKLFQQGVAAGLATAGETFKLTDDIALDAAWPGIGVKNGKDLVNHKSGTAQSVIDADLATFEAGAFRGTFDGQNHTVSGFQMQGGNLDYCGFFNSTLGATISNLKIQYAGSLFAADTTSSTEECGAAFVGVAKTSTLQNLTTVAGSVSCGKGFGGIVGYLMAGSTVDSCTNNVNLTSLAPNKCGGIAMITQGGSGTATIRNCVNNGTTTGNTKQKGGIVGYVGVATSIEDCTVTAASEPTFLSLYSTVTVSGVNVAPATAKPCIDKDGNDKVVSGLTFATVDNGVATFVADNALAAGNTYKVMSAGATATYEFAAAGTIAFDTALATPTYAVTIPDANLYDLTDATEGTVKTYTAAGGVAVATIVIGDVTNKYNTIQKAIAAADAGETKTVDLVANADISGELNIPAGVTVVLASGVSLGNVTALSGKGVLSVPSGTLVPLVQTDHAASLLRDAEKWAGTLFIKNATMTGPDGLAYYGNANSTVRFENVWLINYSSSHAIGTLELVGAGVYIQKTSGNMTLPCALVGDGSISLRDASDTQRTVLFSGDVSAFAGNVTVATDTKSRIVFGTNASTQGNNNCIVVDSGASVTVAEGKTWTAPNGYVIKGTATVSGTLAAGSEKVYGAGCVIYTSATAAAASAPIAGSWTGTYVVGWAPTGAFNPNTYGNANSTVVLSNDLAASAYFGPGSATTLTINPTVRIATDVEIKNGYSKADDTCLVTFTKLTGDHKFTTSPGTGGTDANPTTRRYAITTLDNFTGSLKVKAGSELRIATVNVADGTNLSGLIIPAECDAKSTVEGAHADGVITGALALTVAGVDSGKVLEYKADGADGAGLYVKTATTPTIDPEAAEAVVEVDGDGDADADAIAESVPVAVPSAIEAAIAAGVAADPTYDYQANFTKTAVYNSESGKWEVTAKIAETVEATVEASAITALEDLADPEAEEVKVAIPAGLYYRITPATELGTWGSAATGLSSGSVVAPALPSGTTGQGFYKIELGTKAFSAE